MKKYLLLLVSLCVFGISFSEERLSDVSIYQDISQLYKNEYYPGAIEKVDLLQSTYPDSVFTQPSLFIKARSLIKLNYYEEAKVTLQNTIAHMHTGKEGFAQCNYLLGIAHFYLKEYEEAIDSFYLTCKLSLINDEEEYYDSAVFYAAESYYILKDFENAYPLYEHVITNGDKYEKGEYTACVLRLMDCYMQTAQYEKAISFYDSIISKGEELSTEEKEYFNQTTVTILTLYAGQACENNKEYERSYELYSKVIESGNETLSVVALKNAYILSEKNLIDVSIGKLFSRVSSTFNNKSLVDDFWIRLAIDEYNNKNYEKALTYFDNVEGNGKDNIITIYKARIALDTNLSFEGAKQAEEILSHVVLPENKREDPENISDSYHSLLLQCKVQTSNWSEVPVLFAKLINPSYQDIYNLSSYFYKKGSYDKVDSSTGVLYASSLCKRGMYEEACKEFETLHKENKLEAKYYSEWGKALFILGNYKKAYEITSFSEDNQKDYILALCKINTNEKEEAKEHLISYIKKMSNKDDFNVLSLYYKGYIEYSLEEYKNAYNTFVRFGLEASNKYMPYIRNSHYYAAMASLQSKDYENAIEQASEYVLLSINEQDRIKATIFNFEILNDAKEYDKALSLMLPFVETKSSFTPNALFLIADVYGKMGKEDLADKTYKELYTLYPQSELAEEAMYKCGEVYYFAKDYQTAFNRFHDYTYKYLDGKFLDAALYFSGDSAFKLAIKNKDEVNKELLNKAIMVNNTMLMKFPDSIYSYGANKTLMDCYYEKGSYDKTSYENALEIARTLMKKYPEQARTDNIGTKIKELEQIVGGIDHEIAEKLSLYEKEGKEATKKGREIGSEIVSLYSEKSVTQNVAFEMAETILLQNIEDDEYHYIADVAAFAGDYCRGNSENIKAAEYYLDAAKYYRGDGNSTKAANVLYSACESYVAAGNTADARNVRDTLKELYPDSNYASIVDDIVR